MVSSENDYLLRISHFQGEQEADDLATLLTSVDVVSHKQISRILGNNIVLLLRLVLVSHFLEHMKQISVLTVDVTKDLDWRLKLNERLFVLKALLDLLNQKLNHLVRKIDEWDTLGVF